MRGSIVPSEPVGKRIAPGGRAVSAGDSRPRQRHGANQGQSALIVAVLIAFVVIPVGLGLFEWRMQEVTYTALQAAARMAARDGAGAFAAGTLTAGAPQLDPGEVAAAVQESLATNLRATLPEVSPSDATAAARVAATTGLAITGLTVCVTVAVPAHFITRQERIWTYSARACAHSIVPGVGP